MIRRLYGLRGHILLVHIVLSFLSAALLAPLASGAVRLAVRLSGKPALTDFEIARFFLTPIGFLCLIAGVCIVIVLASLEIAALLWLLRQGPASQSGLVAQALLRVVAMLPRLFAVALLLVSRLAAAVAPFLVLLAAIAWYFLGSHDINYYLSIRPTEFYTAIAVAVPIVLVMGWFVLRLLAGWVFVLPVVMYTATPLSRVFSRSRELASAHLLDIAKSLALWALASLALGAAATGIFRLVVEWAIPDLNLPIAQFAWVGASILLAWSLILLITGATSAAFLAGLVDNLATKAGLDAPANEPEAPLGQPKLVWTAFAAMLVLSTAGTAFSLATASTTQQKIEVIAHRGAAGARPENTLAAVDKAIADGADWVEIDVQENADGEVVVVHDKDFMKLAGNPIKVWEATNADLARIDIGSWFSPQYAGERTPTLKAVLELARGRVRVLVELKYYGHDERLAERVVALVEETRMQDSTAFMSLEPAQVARIRALRPQWRIGTLAARSIGNLARIDSDFLAVSASMASPAFIGHARAVRKDVLVWTVNDPLSMSRMASRGATGMITNEPALARTVLDERAKLTLTERLMIELADVFGIDARHGKYRDVSP